MRALQTRARERRGQSGQRTSPPATKASMALAIHVGACMMACRGGFHDPDAHSSDRVIRLEQGCGLMRLPLGSVARAGQGRSYDSRLESRYTPCPG